VHTADLQDRAAVSLVLEGAAQEFPRLEHLWVDQGYTGTGKAVGEERYELGPGDCVLAPREVAHVWAHVGEGTGRLIGALQPAGQIEAFFDELAKLGSSPEREDLSRAFSSHGMELVGPPLSIE
jgi:hypothetical protein